MVDGESKHVVPRTVWNKTGHFARDHGSHLISAFLGGKRFDFPKSLYAVEDTLRFVVSAKPNAVILDFFAGSGTTAHAVMRLNRQDGGRRKSISVTNNEVGATDGDRLRLSGARPGDQEWEALGICDYVTKPRIEAAIRGQRSDGSPVEWEYKFVDEFDASDGFEENASFFTLTYETPLTVSHNGAFERIAPLLWLRAGSVGRIINDLGNRGWDVAKSYGVLQNLDRSTEFVRALAQVDAAQIAFVVTNDDRRFQMVCGQLPSGVLPVRLYESYLLNFEVNTGRGIA